jgi:hypothetical protein
VKPKLKLLGPQIVSPVRTGPSSPHELTAISSSREPLKKKKKQQQRASRDDRVTKEFSLRFPLPVRPSVLPTPTVRSPTETRQRESDDTSP